MKLSTDHLVRSLTAPAGASQPAALLRWLAVAVAGLVLLGACRKQKDASAEQAASAAPGGRSKSGVMTVVREQQATWTRNFNPLISANQSRWPTTAGVYEPLFVRNSIKGEYVPWLAEEYAWSNDKRTLFFKIREGVHWTDGKPLTANDVAFTFNLIKEHRALDLRNVWRYLESVAVAEVAGDSKAGTDKAGTDPKAADDKAEGSVVAAANKKVMPAAKQDDQAGDEKATDDKAAPDKAAEGEGADPANAAPPFKGQVVVAKLKDVHVPLFDEIVQQPIVAEHVWKAVKDPVKFTNPDPVATGPFAVVKSFQNQSFELAKNPNYWQKGKPYLKGLKMPAYPGNEQINMALANGEIDWTGTFIQNVEKVYVERDKAHHKYWFPLTQGTTMLYANTVNKPFDDVRVRKAISMAINRARTAKVAVHGYAPPADATALSRGLKRWRSEAAAKAGKWTEHNPTRANQLLDEAGFTKGDDGIRRGPDGQRLSYEIISPAGFSDWIAAVPLIASDLKAVGVEAKLKTYDFQVWYQKVQNGEFNLSLGWTEEGPSPYTAYLRLMSRETVKPVGEAAPQNWHRYANPQAEELLARYAKTNDFQEQKQLAHELQEIFVENAPAIPLWPNPSWGECNTKYFEDFPSAEQPYASLSPHQTPEILLLLTRVKPRAN